MLDILGRFVHLQVEEKTETDQGEQDARETMIFPRYPPARAVRRLEGSSRERGRGAELPDPALGRQRQEQHYRVARAPARVLHDARNERSSTRHRHHRPPVLDRQLQDTIYQFDHKQGVVQKIDEDSSSSPMR